MENKEVNNTQEVSSVEKESWYQRLKKRKGFGLLSTFVKSAAVGLLFAIVCFAYDMYNDSQQDEKLEETVEKLSEIEETVAKLEDIEQALSTRYLGIFPRYIPDINELFDGIDNTDTIVIFEDVLYYGIKSEPLQFRNLNAKLLQHLMNNGELTFAYYDYNREGPAAFNLFHKMIIESRIAFKYQSALDDSIRMGNRRLREFNKWTVESSSELESAICEKFFDMTRKDDIEKFKSDVEAYLNDDLVSVGVDPNSPYSEVQVYKMCLEIDSIKQYYLGNGKDIMDIHFCDYEQMYKKMSETIVKYYTDATLPSKANLVPMNDYLTMSSWLVIKGRKKGIKAVLAFPSKYSTDEIGFYSQDEAFARYITTMLEGVKNNIRNRAASQEK